ncbi:membrane protein, putative [Lunatimonas lonarensis]|uniref:Membrane protein, putative n=1 Tax=Lunatimonas lonarensis TaxID=1232681 RepID=R7ZT80_9BACT|nr:DUF4271 domain-containing protein [Lunatimonas lonarensis]EON77335.1 membrane protein, putative [Lunatimonas lonarensis]
MNRTTTALFVFFFLYIFMVASNCHSQVLENYDSRISYLPPSEFYSASVGVQVAVDLGSFPLSTLMVHLPQGSSLFLDTILWFQTSRDTTLMLPLKDAQQALSMEAGEMVLTIYRKGIQKKDVSVQKMGPIVSDRGVTASQLLLLDSYSTRNRDVFEEFFYSALLLLLLLAALFKVINPLVLPMFLNPRYLVSSEDFTEGGSFTKLFNNALLYYLLMLNMLLMLLFLTISKHLDIAPLGIQLSNDLNHYYFLWIAGTLILMFASFLKFIWLRMNVFIFGISRFEIPHFLFILRVLSISLVLILLVMLVVLANGYSSMGDLAVFFNKAFTGYYLLSLALLATLMRKRLSFKNYHLFSYICTSELIPFLVISRLLIG